MRCDGVPLAFVVPRYGTEIVGGAETLARVFAERLPSLGFDVDVLTTCALDHHSWRNVLPEGEERHGEVTVRRFPVSPRDVSRFLAVQERLSAGLPLEAEEELDWAAGSVNSEPLYEFLAEQGERYAAILFLPYLFGTTLLGSQILPERSVLIPCLHDEPFARLRVVEHLFASVRGAIFNSVAERRLAGRLFGVSAGAPVVGLGFDVDRAPSNGAGNFRRRIGLDGDYLLYFGRKEGGKNLPLLLEHFAACAGAGEDLFLVVAGDGTIDPGSRPAGVVDLPRLDEAEKHAACAGALALCQPSVNESFSIVLMEAWLQETPALVNARCAVTRAHVRAAGGGLYFASAAEFAAEVAYLRAHRDEAREMGRSGRRYVVDQYSWEHVLPRFSAALASVLG